MRNRAVRTLMLALGLAISLALPLRGAASAAPRAVASQGPEVAKARQHFKAGEKAFNAGDYARALAEFEAGYLLVPRPGFLLNMAHSERRLGHAARARELYRRYLDADPGSPQRDEVLGLISEVDRAVAAQAVPGNGGADTSAAADVSPAAASPPPTAPDSGVAPLSSWPGEPEEPAAPPPAAAAAAPAAPARPPRAPPPIDKEAPLISTRPPSSAPESPSASRPVYQRWWFWTAVGVVAVGATAGIIVGTRSGGPAFQSDGTLGRVGQP